MVQFYLVCQTAEEGWSAGDVITILEGSIGTAANGNGIVCKVDSTNVTVYIGNRTGMFTNVTNNYFGSTGAAYYINVSNWKLRIVAST
jgi:hypothetical protein